MSVAGRTLPYLSKFSSSSFFRFGGRPRLLPVFPGTFGVFVCSPHPLKKRQNHHEIPAEQGNRGRRNGKQGNGRRGRKWEQLLGTQPKEGLNPSSNRNGEGRAGIPTGWEPDLGAAGTAPAHGAGQTGRNVVGQAALLPQQALLVPQRLHIAAPACDTIHNSQSAWQLWELPLGQAPAPPRHNSSQAEETPSSTQTWEGGCCERTVTCLEPALR